MATIINKHGNQITLTSNGVTTIITPNKDNYYKLPKNDADRTWLAGTKVDDLQDGDMMELSPKTERLSTGTASSSKWTDYLTDEEKLIIEELKKKCTERAEAKKNSPEAKRERLMAQIKKLEEEIIKIK